MALFQVEKGGEKYLDWAKRKLRWLSARRIDLGVPALSQHFKIGASEIWIKASEFGDVLRITGVLAGGKMDGQVTWQGWLNSNSGTRNYAMVPQTAAGVTPTTPWDAVILHEANDYYYTEADPDSTPEDPKPNLIKRKRRHWLRVWRFMDVVAEFTWDEGGIRRGDDGGGTSIWESTQVYSSHDTSNGATVTVYDTDETGTPGAPYQLTVSPSMRTQWEGNPHGLITVAGQVDATWGQIHPGEQPTPPATITASVSGVTTAVSDPGISPPPHQNSDYKLDIDWTYESSDGGATYSATTSGSITYGEFPDGTLGPANGFTDIRYIIGGDFPATGWSLGGVGTTHTGSTTQSIAAGTYDDYGQGGTIPPISGPTSNAAALVAAVAAANAANTAAYEAELAAWRQRCHDCARNLLLARAALARQRLTEADLVRSYGTQWGERVTAMGPFPLTFTFSYNYHGAQIGTYVPVWKWTTHVYSLCNAPLGDDIEEDFELESYMTPDLANDVGLYYTSFALAGGVSETNPAPPDVPITIELEGLAKFTYSDISYSFSGGTVSAAGISPALGRTVAAPLTLGNHSYPGSSVTFLAYGMSDVDNEYAFTRQAQAFGEPSDLSLANDMQENCVGVTTYSRMYYHAYHAKFGGTKAAAYRQTEHYHENDAVGAIPAATYTFTQPAIVV